MSTNTSQWCLYILDDKDARHLLMDALVECANSKATEHGLGHRFHRGFPTGKELRVAEIKKALEDHTGIWLVDLKIPQGDCTGSVESIGAATLAESHPDLRLAERVINVLRNSKRPFLVISSATMTGGETQDAEKAIDVNGVRFDSADHIQGVVHALIALTEPKSVFPRAFGEALKRLAQPIYHTKNGTRAGRPMFAPSEAGEPEPVHKLCEWDALYPGRTPLPQEVTNALNTLFPQLFREWNLDLSELAKYPVLRREDDWVLAAAKAVNSESIHRAFLFCLRPESVTEDCLPSVRKMICARNNNMHPVALGMLALQNLLGPNNGFALKNLSAWQTDSEDGVQLLLKSTKSGCAGEKSFCNVLNDATWQPSSNPNNGETSRLLRQVRNSFVTESSSVVCDDGKLVLKLRFKEKPLE